MTSRQISWVLGGLLFGAVIWIALRTVTYIQGHNHIVFGPNHVVLSATAFVLVGGLLGWIGAKILRIK